MSSGPASKGWYRRGYLPHLEVPNRAQGITFRLADSVPSKVIETWESELRPESDERSQAELRRRISSYEDSGRGECWLREDCHAEVVAEALGYFDGDRYRLLEWCIMPNHVHVLISVNEGCSIGQIVGSWKSFTARRIHKQLRRTGSFWAPDYFDRLVRGQEHLAKARQYIRNNPVKAGLCATAEKWRWGSAWAD